MLRNNDFWNSGACNTECNIFETWQRFSNVTKNSEKHVTQNIMLRNIDFWNSGACNTEFQISFLKMWQRFSNVTKNSETCNTEYRVA